MNSKPNILRRQVSLQAVADYQVPNQDALNTPITDEEGQSRGYKMFGFNRGFKVYPYNGRKFLELRSLERIYANKAKKVIIHAKSTGYCAGINFTRESWEKLKQMAPLIDRAFEDVDVADLNSGDKAMDNLFDGVQSPIDFPMYNNVMSDVSIPFEEADTDEYEEEEEDDENLHVSDNNDKGDQTKSQLMDGEFTKNGKTIEKHMYSGKNKVLPVMYVHPYQRSPLMKGGAARDSPASPQQATPPQLVTLE